MKNIICKNSFLEGMSSSQPVCIAFAFIYFSIGVLANIQGIGLWNTTLMSITLFSTPLQIFLVNAQNLAIWTAVIAAIIINFRFSLMSALLMQNWKLPKTITIPSLHFICMSTYMVSSTNKTTLEPWSFYLGVSLPSYIVAIATTIIGYHAYYFGQANQDILSAISHIIMPAHFSCLTMKKGWKAVFITTTAISLTPLIIQFLGKQWTFLVWLSLAGILAIVEEKYVGNNYSN